MSSNIPSFLRNEYINKDPISLWDARGNFDNGQYFNVEIYSDNNYVENEKDVDSTLNLNTYKCHICNINVPKAYNEEHIQSAKHEMFLKITNIALERTQYHMKADFLHPRRKIEATDTFFCEHCTTIVQNINKNEHILSNDHLNAVKNDGLLQKLVKIYEEPDKNCDGDISSVKDIEIKNLINALAITEVTDESDGTEETEKSSKIENEPKAKQRTSKIGYEPNANQSTSKIENELNAKQSTSKPGNEPNAEENTSKTGNEPNAKQSTSKIENEPNAKQSTSKIENEPNAKQSTSKPENEPNAKQSTSKPGNEPNAKQSTSKIENEPNAKQSTSKPENEPNAKQSTSKPGNEPNAKQSTSKPGNEPNAKQSTSKTETESNPKQNTTKIETGTSIYSETLDDMKLFLEIASFIHTKAVDVTAHSEDSVYISASKSENIKVPLKNFHGYTVTGQDVVCKICLDMKSVDGKKHKWTDVHMKNVMSPIKEGYFRQISDQLNHCILCNSIHSASKIAAHVASSEHTSNLRKYAAFKYNISSRIAHLAAANCMRWTYDKTYCKICEIQLPKTNDSINAHIQSSVHTKKHASLLSVNKITKISNKRGYYHCIMCVKTIWHGQLVEHCKYSQHVKRIASLGN